jgi:hypothetical protein
MMNAMTPIVIDIFINADMTLIQLQCHLSFKYYIFGKLPVLSKFDLQTLQYSLISFEGNSVPQFLQIKNFSSSTFSLWP